MLAGLTLLIAGFVARHEIPNLIEETRESPAPPAQADTGSHSLRGGMPDYHPPSHLYAGAIESGQKPAHSESAADGSGEPRKNAPHESITDSEREQLNRVIKEKSR
jgi:hypothetical protein